MKKNKFIIILLLLAVTLPSIVIGAEYQKGDVNKDGRITKEDANIILSYAARKEECPEADMVLADIDEDGEITVTDALIVLRYCNGLSESLDDDEISITGVLGDMDDDGEVVLWDYRLLYKMIQNGESMSDDIKNKSDLNVDGKIDMVDAWILLQHVNEVEGYEILPYTGKLPDSYHSYKAGDLIKVKLNDNTILDFYVIKNSNANSNVVTAIYKDVIGEPKYYEFTTGEFSASTLELNLFNNATKKWINAMEVRLINEDEIITGEINYANNSFTEPSYFNIGKSYWTQTIKNANTNYFGVIVLAETSSSSLMIVHPEDEEKAYIRPVITIDKSMIIEKTAENETNPSTGDYTIYLIGAAILVAMGSIYSYKKCHE